jgi:hypothetical protein
MAWRVSAKRGLPITKQSSWSGSAKANILNQFKKPGGGYKAGAAGAFLIADSSKSGTQEGYKLPFAVVSNGKITGASTAGLAAAARRLPQVKGVPESVKTGARSVIDAYQKKAGTGKAKETEDMTQPTFEELQLDIGTLSRQVRRAFRLRFRMRSPVVDSMEDPGWLFVEDIFVDHPTLGSVVIIDKTGELWQVTYDPDVEGFDFGAPNTWVKVVRTYVPVGSPAPATEVAEVDAGGAEMAELAEAELGTVLSLSEDDTGTGPLVMEVAVIEPGWGNKRNNNYYPTSFTESGAPIARVGVFNTQFAENIRGRAKLGVLDSLHCSILAGGKVKPGFSENGRTGREVVQITEVASVDWVTRAGAGGRALSLAESDELFMEADMNEHDDVLDTEAEAMPAVQEAEVVEVALSEDEAATATVEDETEEQEEETTEEPAPAPTPTATEPVPAAATESAQPAAGGLMELGDVKSILKEVKNLPEATIAKLQEGSYHNRYEVIAAIQAEKEYLTMITESGKPPKFAAAEEQQAELSEADVRRKQDEINAQFLPGVRAPRAE